MTEQYDKNYVVVYKRMGSWRVGYAYKGELLEHEKNCSGTYNNIVSTVHNLVLLPFDEKKFKKVQYPFDLTLFNPFTSERTSLKDLPQQEAVNKIRSQEVVKPRSFHTAAADTVLSLDDEQVVEAFQSGVVPKIKPVEEPVNIGPSSDAQNAIKYPKYWRLLPASWKAIDTYRINALFPIQDDSGRLIHARKKLLVPGIRTGGKSLYTDIKEARDTLNGWLADNEGLNHEQV